MKTISELLQNKNIKLTFSEYNLEPSDWLSVLNDISLVDIDRDVLEDKLYEAICQFSDYHFIYYSDALAFLNKYDVCLRDSLALAAECAYSCRDLNSSILAYLLLKDKLNDQLNVVVTQILELISAELEGV